MPMPKKLSIVAALLAVVMMPTPALAHGMATITAARDYRNGKVRGVTVYDPTRTHYVTNCEVRLYRKSRATYAWDFVDDNVRTMIDSSFCIVRTKWVAYRCHKYYMVVSIGEVVSKTGYLHLHEKTFKTYEPTC
jgi:hypothetical protein